MKSVGCTLQQEKVKHFPIVLLLLLAVLKDNTNIFWKIYTFFFFSFKIIEVRFFHEMSEYNLSDGEEINFLKPLQNRKKQKQKR